ncbi:MAG: DMT family transporter [Cyanobacteria bacterium CAN_BIN43]|nr:DMT family transporter [Cyanobacteria bacterium CAN_BIN43]
MMQKSAFHYWYVLILVGTTLVWGTTFPLLKDALTTLSPAVLVCIRFLVGTLVLLPWCRHFNARLVRDGAILGVVIYLSFVTQVIGLQTISSNRSAFITSLNVIMVPLLGFLLGRSLSRRVWMSAGLALAGIGILSWEEGVLGIGDLWVLGCALSYAVYILLMEAIAPHHPPLALTIYQLITTSLLGLMWAAPELLEQAQAIQQNWGAIAYLGIMATAMTTWTQAIVQRHVNATETAIVYTLEPVFAAIFSFWWLGESLGIRGLLGGGMVLVAMVWSQIQPQR